MDPEHPFESMARRLVYNSYNGGARHRIDRLLELCREHSRRTDWSTSATGAARAPRARPSWCAPGWRRPGSRCFCWTGTAVTGANGSDGQTSTRLGAFLEMLEANRAKAAEQEADQ